MKRQDEIYLSLRNQAIQARNCANIFGLMMIRGCEPVEPVRPLEGTLDIYTYEEQSSGDPPGRLDQLIEKLGGKDISLGEHNGEICWDMTSLGKRILTLNYTNNVTQLIAAIAIPDYNVLRLRIRGEVSEYHGTIVPKEQRYDFPRWKLVKTINQFFSIYIPR